MSWAWCQDYCPQSTANNANELGRSVSLCIPPPGGEPGGVNRIQCVVLNHALIRE
jgi:hypothetical protein